MHITHVVESLDRGGLEVMVIALIQEQIIQGHQCSLICIFEEGELAPELLNAQIKILTCKKKHGFDINTIKKIRQYLHNLKPNVVHTHNPLPHYYTVFAARKLAIRKIINTRHGMGRDPFSARRELLFRLAMIYSDATACVSKTSLNRFTRLHMVPKKKALVINNGINLNKRLQKSTEKKRALLKECQLAGDTKIIGTVGRLEPIKNHMMLLRAFKRINQNNSATALVIIGGGSEEVALKNFVNENNMTHAVRFLGPSNNVAEHLAGFDLFAMTSVSEGYSMALLEAAAAGLPIVATDVGGNHEIVQNNINGLLVPNNDHEALANTTDKMLTDKALLQRMGNAGRSWVENNATIEIMAQQYQRIYES